MALKKGKATDAVAKLFSVSAVETKEELHMPEAREAHEAYEEQAKPRMPHMPDTHEAYEVQFHAAFSESGTLRSLILAF